VGTFAKVRLVKDKTTGRHYALKIMSLPRITRLQQFAHIKEEREILKDIQHPFIVDL
jgi:serine/threonine protein kinase